MSKEYRISSEQVTVRHSQEKKEVKFIVPLKDQLAFMVFDDIRTGDQPSAYVLCDLKNGKLLSEGPFYSKIDKVENLDDDIIVFVDLTDYKLKAFSVRRRCELTNIGSISAPSFQALPQSSRNEEALNEAITDLNLVCFAESKSVVMFEKKQTLQNFTDFILTVHCFDSEFLERNLGNSSGESRVIQISTNLPNNNKRIGKLNKMDVLVIAPETFTEVPKSSKIQVWNFLDPKLRNTLEQVTLESNLDGTAVSLTGWKEQGDVAFWLNGKANRPQIYVYNWITKKETECFLNLYGGSGNFMIKDVFDVNFELERIIMNNIQNSIRNNCIDIANPLTHTVTYTQAINSSEDSLKFSQDSKYFITFMSQSSNQVPENVISVHSIVGVQTSLLYFLEQKKIIDIYGEEASKAILDMLTEQPQIEDQQEFN